MGEFDGARYISCFPEHADIDRFLDQRTDGLPDQCAQGRPGTAFTQDSGSVDDLPRRRVQRRGLESDQPADVGALGEDPGQRCRVTDQRGCTDRLGDQVDQQGVPAGPVVQFTGQRRGHGVCREVPHPALDVRRAEPRQRQVGQAGRPGQPVHRRIRRRLWTVGHHQQHPGPGEFGRDMFEQGQRLSVGPLHVLQHDQQPARLSMLRQGVADVAEQPEACRPLAGTGARRLLQKSCHGGDVPERSAPRPERWCAPVIDRGSPRPRHPALSAAIGDRPGQPGLPDPGLTADQHQPTRAGQRAGQGAPGRGQRRLSPDHQVHPGSMSVPSAEQYRFPYWH